MAAMRDPAVAAEPPRTVLDVLERARTAYASWPALRVRRGGAWRTTTWAEYGDQVFRAARAFMKLGVTPGRAVAILGRNAPEWFIADLAAIAAGGFPVGIYTTSVPEQTRYIADHAGAAVVVLEGPEVLGSFLAIRDRLPRVKAIVLMSGEAPGVYSWSEFLALSEAVPQPDLARRMNAQRPDDLATLIYTSGTTGPPKGVMLSHANLVWMARALTEAIAVSPDDRLVSYLPLSHIAEQMLSIHMPLAAGALICFAESPDKLPETLRHARPTIFFGVPRVWEKMQAAIEAAEARSGILKRRLLAWARRVGLAAGYADQRGEPRPALYRLADRLVFSNLRERLGLDRTRLYASSAAPIARSTLEFFLGLGIPVVEGYGMSECTGPTTLSLPSRYRTGKAGFALPGTELRTADDGEILMRGPHVFRGYYKDEAATREVVDAQGWLHSGDVGELDEEGFVTVTDRKKEILITSGGKNVAPQPIEARLKRIPGVAHAVVVGDRRKHLAALLTLDPQRVPSLAEAAASSARDLESAARCPRLRAYIEAHLARVNEALARVETIKRFAILPMEFTIDGGELTPTMKLRRRVIYERYACEIESLYA